MKRMDMKEQLSTAFDCMAKSRGHLFALSERALDAQTALKCSETQIINNHDPKELGGNEAARSAKIREMTSKEHATVDDIEKEKRHAAFMHEVNCMIVDSLKWQIRADLAAKGMVI